MLKLILIELKKISKKKSILIIIIIMSIFNVLNNILFYTDYDKNGNYKYLENNNIKNEKQLLKKEIEKYNYNEKNNISTYIDLKTKLDVINLKEKYKINTWQYNKVEDYLYEILKNINIYTYQINDEEILKELKITKEQFLIKFQNNNWQYFANNEIDNLEIELFELEKNLKLINNEIEKQNIKEIISNKNKELNDLKYRLENNITYDNNYLNITLNNYNNSLNEIKYYENKINNLTNKELFEYQKIKENLEINKYILKNKKNYNKPNNLNNQLRTIVDDYEIFIIIIILLITSTIVAEEFTSGTIKLLLIKPYSRGKILLSKYFTSIIFLLLIILYLILLQIFIGGYIFGFSSLKIPVIIYDFSKDAIIEYNIFIYMIIRIITKLPLLLMMITISFSLSTIINSISTSITIPLFIYIFTPSINYLILQYKIYFLKYLVNINWDFNNYLFGKKSEIEGLELKTSLIIWSIYFIMIIIFTYLNFKKKNIRNI